MKWNKKKLYELSSIISISVFAIASSVFEPIFRGFLILMLGYIFMTLYYGKYKED